jgi:hypothetical protein
MSLGDILGIISVLLCLVGFVFSWYLFVKSFTAKAISSYIHSTGDPFSQRTLSSGTPALLWHSDCIIWNSGRQTINGNDLKSERGIEIRLPEGSELVGLPLVQVSLYENKVEASSHGPACVSCRFDYFDPGQGFQVTILYLAPRPTTFPPQHEPPKITAVVAGMPQGVRKREDVGYRSDSFITETFDFMKVELRALLLRRGIYWVERRRPPVLLIPLYTHEENEKAIYAWGAPSRNGSQELVGGAGQSRPSKSRA